MSETSDTKTRDRSPGYPAIPLGTAVERLIAFEAHFKRSPALTSKVGAAWGLKEGNSDADRWLAALRSYGLIEYQNGQNGRLAILSEDGRTYLRAQQESIKQQVLRRAALRPKMIGLLWSEWGNDRPADDACLDQLTFAYKFSERGARAFLKVYDATVAYAGLDDSGKTAPLSGEQEGDDSSGEEAQEEPSHPPMRPPPALAPPLSSHRMGGIALMHGERELTTGLLSKNASFRLIVSGNVGEKEIERLIRKLELDKEILAEAGAESAVATGPGSFGDREPD